MTLGHTYTFGIGKHIRVGGQLYIFMFSEIATRFSNQPTEEDLYSFSSNQHENFDDLMEDLHMANQSDFIEEYPQYKYVNASYMKVTTSNMNACADIFSYGDIKSVESNEEYDFINIDFVLLPNQQAGAGNPIEWAVDSESLVGYYIREPRS